MILVIDNYDSFTFNLVQALQAAGADVRVIRNDQIDRAGVEAMADDPDGGPARHRHLARARRPRRRRRQRRDHRGRRRARDPAARRVSRACSRWRPRSGRRSSGRRPSSTARRREVTHDGAGLLAGMPPAFMAARYHSLCVDPATLPDELRVTAMSEEDGVVMGIRHVALPIEGVQFHPESVLTPQGPHLLANFLRLAGEGEASLLDDATGSFATAGLPPRLGSDRDAARHRGAAMSDARPGRAHDDRRGRHALARRRAARRWAP